MSLVTLKAVLDDSKAKYYAVGAFNFNGIEDARGIVEAAEEKNSPVILMASTSAVSYFGGARAVAAYVRALAEKSPAPIVLHVDHCTDLDLIYDCVDSGFSSVMIDASALAFEENIAKTAAAVKYAKRYGVSVEGELGRLGGREENVDVSDRNANMTDPNAVEEFVARTGIDALAISIGNAHGFYKGTPKLDFDRIVAIRKLVDCGLVLHRHSRARLRPCGGMRHEQDQRGHRAEVRVQPDCPGVHGRQAQRDRHPQAGGRQPEGLPGNRPAQAGSVRQHRHGRSGRLIPPVSRCCPPRAAAYRIPSSHSPGKITRRPFRTRKSGA